MDLDRISWIVDIHVIYEKEKYCGWMSNLWSGSKVNVLYVVLIKPSIDSAAEISNIEQKHATKCKLHKI